jgi:hypothetical protein
MLESLKAIAYRMGIIAGSKGCCFYDSTHGEVTKEVKSFVVNSTCVFSRLVAGSTNSLVEMNLENASLKPGTFISCGDNKFSSFQIASGSVIAYY